MAPLPWFFTCWLVFPFVRGVTFTWAGWGTDGELEDITCPLAPAVRVLWLESGGSKPDLWGLAPLNSCFSLSKTFTGSPHRGNRPHDTAGQWRTSPICTLVCLSAFPSTPLPQTKLNYSSFTINVMSIFFPLHL